MVDVVMLPEPPEGVHSIVVYDMSAEPVCTVDFGVGAVDHGEDEKARKCNITVEQLRHPVAENHPKRPPPSLLKFIRSSSNQEPWQI